MKALEGRLGADSPLLVHTDLIVVDDELDAIDCLVWHYQRLDAKRGRSLGSLLIQNVVTGGASLANRRLKELALPLPGKFACTIDSGLWWQQRSAGPNIIQNLLYYKGSTVGMLWGQKS